MEKNNRTKWSNMSIKVLVSHEKFAFHLHRERKLLLFGQSNGIRLYYVLRLNMYDRTCLPLKRLHQIKMEGIEISRDQDGGDISHRT